MPIVPDDALWRPLFADARVEEVETPAPLGVGETGLRVCWDAPHSVTMPLAVPPPWTATLTVTAPKGCFDAEEEGGTLLVEAPGMALASRGRLGDRVVWDQRWRAATPPHEADILTTGPWEEEIVRFGEGKVEHDGTTWLLGDALPWTRGEHERGDYSEFFAGTGIPIDELARRTGTGPYAGAAIEAYQPFWPRSGPTTARRTALLLAILGIDGDRLTESQQRELAWLRRDLAGWPSFAASGGTATLVVDPWTLEVEVDGKVVLAREMSAQTAAIRAGTATETTVTVDVPADRAVFVRTMMVYADVGAPGVWHAMANEGWSALLPGHRYEVRSGEIAGSAGVACVSASGVEGAQISGGGAQWTVGVQGGWPRPVTVRATEAGRYVVSLDAIGAREVKFEPGACPPPPPPPGPWTTRHAEAELDDPLPGIARSPRMIGTSAKALLGGHPAAALLALPVIGDPRALDGVERYVIGRAWLDLGLPTVARAYLSGLSSKDPYAAASATLLDDRLGVDGIAGVVIPRAPLPRRVVDAFLLRDALAAGADLPREGIDRLASIREPFAI